MSESKSLAIIPRTIAECTDLAQRLSESSLLPIAMKNKMPDVLVTILAGQEMGLSPMASLRSFHVIEGRPVLSSDGLVAVVLGSGKAVYFERVEESADKVTYETLRVGAKGPRRCTWTRQMVKDAALHMKDNHRLYPRQMLASRAKAELARDVYPDVVAGCYTEDEIGAIATPVSRERFVPETPANDIVDAEFTDAPATPDAEIKAIDSAATVEDLKALIPMIQKLSDAQRGVVRLRYAERMAALKSTPPVVEPAAESAA